MTQQRSQETGTLLQQVFSAYRGEGIAMPYTMADWKRDFITEHIKELSPDERRQALEGLSAEERVEGLSLEEIEKVLRKLRGKGPSGRGKRPRNG